MYQRHKTKRKVRERRNPLKTWNERVKTPVRTEIVLVII